jgi:hypothetical protein
MHTSKYVIILMSKVGRIETALDFDHYTTMEVEQLMKCLLAEMKAMQQDRCQPSKDDCQPGMDDSHEGCLASRNGGTVKSDECLPRNDGGMSSH